MIPFLNPWMIACALLALASAGGFGFKLGSDHEIAKQAQALVQQIEQRSEAEKQINTVSQGYERVVAYQNQQIKSAQKGWRDALNNPKYIGCAVGAVGVQYLNQRIQQANHPGQPDAAVPGNPTPSSNRNDVRPDAGALGLGIRLRGLLNATPSAGGGN